MDNWAKIRKINKTERFKLQKGLIYAITSILKNFKLNSIRKLNPANSFLFH